MQPAVEDNILVADLPYPHAGASQHLCLVHCGKSERPCNEELFLDYHNLQRTVLAGAFYPDKQVYIRTPLPPPFHQVLLPPIQRSMLREEVVRDEDGNVLGILLKVPGLFVHAYQLLRNHLDNNARYDYKSAIVNMVKESGRLLSSVIKSGVIRVRSKPGLMGHALEMKELASDEIAISEQFAEKVLEKIQQELPLQFGSVWDLDGFPVFATRFPVANRFGVQECYLRILPGTGRYIACNPFNLAKLWLGDRDGDALFALLRWEDIRDGNLEIVKRPRVEVNRRIKGMSSCVTLQSLLDVKTINCEAKLQGKMETPDLSTHELRMQYIKDADTRTHVATYTMVFGWWVPRVLAASGRYNPQEAYQLGNDLLEIFIEWCMDARKGGSPLSDPSFDCHKFMRLLRFGKRRNENIDFDQLGRMGVPANLVGILKEAWEISGGNLPEYCSQSPFYRALVIGRNSQEQGIPRMLMTSQAMEIGPEEMYMSIVNDLTCRECVSLSDA